MRLAKEPKDINLIEIFNAVNEKVKLIKIHSDPQKSVPLGGRIEDILSGHFLRAKTALENELKSVTLQDLLANKSCKVTLLSSFSRAVFALKKCPLKISSILPPSGTDFCGSE
ncbi:Rrf2 family transcriptional regulator [Campylobacter concisus]|uniref:Rrf2 family transcriptional regulator n=1 Tax=Campylobacter concisus TaxID=199 RepID=UPI0021562A8B|nr:Rrf2 family transcriptional regulator [Campylobacter concisus]